MSGLKKVVKAKWLTIGFVAFGFVGLGTLLLTHAATPTAKFEPENGALATGATVVTDSAASNGKAAQFSNPGMDAANLPGWGLPAFRDEFDYRDAQGQLAMNPAKWKVWTRSGAGGLGLLNDASVVDSSQVAAVTINGLDVARIRAQWLPTPVSTTTGPRSDKDTAEVEVTDRWHKTGYFDAQVSGGPSYSQRYGRWEARMKVPIEPGSSMGTLAAFWLRNTSSGETDIMETWGSGPAEAGPVPTYRPQQPKTFPSTSTLTIHTQTSGDSTNRKKFWTTPVIAPTTGFHTWALEWTPTYLKYTLDGVVVADVAANSSQAVIPDSGGQTLWTHPSFSTPWFVKFNLHIGPSTQYWGLPDPIHKEWTADNQDFLIDYVRIWPYKP